MILFQLFYEFFITGLFIFGGGLAAIPFLQQMAEKTGWFTVPQLMDMIAVSEATPGPIGVNMATYVGFIVAGIPGGLIATLGLLLPSTIIALVVARLLQRFRESSLVESALYGLRPASLGLIASAGLTVFSLSVFGASMWDLTFAHLSGLFDPVILLFVAVLFVLTNRFKAHPVVFLAASAVVGIFVF
jgi:chromate transporter